MKFGLVNGSRHEAQPHLIGECPGCGRQVVAKCGEVRVWHWAHKGREVCDLWWESETPWHREWKDNFPAEWQEIVHTASSGERHIADVKTANGWVLEFQHSHITPDERRSRDAFYPQLVWVVDGTRRKRDREHLIRAWKGGVPVASNQLLRRTISADYAALREWTDGRAPVCFDLGDKETLLFLLPVKVSGFAYLHPISRAQFVVWHRAATKEGVREFEEFVGELPTLIAAIETRTRAQQSGSPPMSGRSPRRRFRL